MFFLIVKILYKRQMISKQDLARLYCPDKSRRNALDTLNGWINNCYGLRERLDGLGLVYLCPMFVRKKHNHSGSTSVVVI